MKPKILESVMVPIVCVLYLFLKHELDLLAPVNILVGLLLVGVGSLFHYYVWRAVEAYVFGTNN